MELRKELLKEIPTTIETARLVIRRYKNGDGKDLLALLERNDNREFLKEHVDEASDIHTLDEAEIRIRTLILDFDARKRYVMGIWLKSPKKFIGNIWIEPKKLEVPSFELGYYIDQGYIRKGYATEACKRSIKFIFEELLAHKIIILTRDTNMPSYKLAEHLGFYKEGHLRDHIKEGNKRIGLLQYSLLRMEYLESELYK